MRLIPFRCMKLKRLIPLILIICAGCSGVIPSAPPVVISGDTCLLPPVVMDTEAKCFVYSTCTKWEKGSCKSWPRGFKNYIEKMDAHNNSLEDLQPACPKRKKDFNPEGCLSLP